MRQAVFLATAALVLGVPDRSHAQSVTGVETRGGCSPGVVAGRDAHVDIVCGMTPKDVGLAIAAAQGKPVRVEVGGDGTYCSPSIQARRDAIVSVVCGVPPAELGRVVSEATAAVEVVLDDSVRQAGVISV